MTKAPYKKNIWLLTPVFGSLVFIFLYITATFFYPGGSQANKNAVGFSWAQNYWCNLLMDNAINGQHNPAKPIALTAMLILCLTLALFWYMFPLQVRFSKTSRLVIQISGIMSMLIGVFLFTNLHDIVIDVACLFGIVAFIGTCIGIYRMNWRNYSG